MIPTPRRVAAVLCLALLLAAGPEPGYLGIAAKPAEPAAAAEGGFPAGVGLTVTFVDPDGPAAAAVRAGDVLLKLDDQLLVNTPQMSTLIRLHQPGETVTLTIVRGGKRAAVPVTLGERPATQPPPSNPPDKIPTLPGVIGPDPATGRLPDDPQLPLPGNATTAVTFADATYAARVTTDLLGHRTMVVRAVRDNRVVATGPVDTPAQWDAFPADVRQHLQAVRNVVAGGWPATTRP